MEAACPFETSEAVYPTTHIHGPEEGKGRSNSRNTAKNRECDTVCKILRHQKFAALPIIKMEVTDTRQSTFLPRYHWQISQQIQDIIWMTVRNNTQPTKMHSVLTYSMEHSPSWEANRFSDSQEIPYILCNPKVHYCIHKRPPPVPVLNQINPVIVHHSTSWKSRIILSSHLGLGLPGGLGVPHQ